jgi:hypothetical protein
MRSDDLLNQRLVFKLTRNPPKYAIVLLVDHPSAELSESAIAKYLSVLVNLPSSPLDDRVDNLTVSLVPKTLVARLQ